jgi:hypothetical protein
MYYIFLFFQHKKGFETMKKDVVYPLRMSSRVREALNQSAKKDSRTVASLLDKIIIEHLSEEGYLRGPEFGTERREFPRKKITIPARTFVEADSEEKSFPGVVLDISMGGVLITYPKGSDIKFTSMGELPRFELCLELPRVDEKLCFDCDVRHMHDTGTEIQIGATFGDSEEDCLQMLNSYLM